MIDNPFDELKISSPNPKWLVARAIKGGLSNPTRLGESIHSALITNL